MRFQALVVRSSILFYTVPWIGDGCGLGIGWVFRGPKDLPRISRTAGRLTGRVISYVQMGHGKLDNILQQSQGRHVHKELQDTMAQLEVIFHKVRSLSVLNLDPLTRRMDNMDPKSRISGNDVAQKLTEENVPTNTIIKKYNSTTPTVANLDVIAKLSSFGGQIFDFISYRSLDQCWLWLGNWLGFQRYCLWILIGATAFLIGPKDLLRISRTSGRLIGRAITYVQMDCGQLGNILQQSQARQVHKELQDTMSQLKVIRHKVRSLSVLNPGPLTRRMDNMDPKYRISDNDVAQKLTEKNVPINTIIKGSSSETSTATNLKRKATTYSRLVESKLKGSEDAEKLKEEIGLLAILLVSAERVGLLPNSLREVVVLLIFGNLGLWRHDSWGKSNTYYVMTSYLQPLLLWFGASLLCRTLDPVVQPTVVSQVVKRHLLIFVRSLSTVLVIAYCLSRWVFGYCILSRHCIVDTHWSRVMSTLDSMGVVFNYMLKGSADFFIKPVRKNELRNLWQHVWRRHNTSIPDDASKVAEFQKIIELTTEFEAPLKDLIFISMTDKKDEKLGSFVQNVEVHFAARKKNKILANARNLLFHFDSANPSV